MTTFFTSDIHVHHENIMRLCSRKFASVKEMNAALIERYNSRITDEDTCYILGDSVWGNSYEVHEEFFKKLKGKKIIILGNHDNAQIYKRLLINKIIDGVHEVLGITVGKTYIWLSHYPHRSWNRSYHGAWHLFGHCHNTIPDYGMSVDVGVDKWNFYPVSFEELQEYFKDRMLDLNSNVRDNYNSYKKKFEKYFTDKYTERINDEAHKLEKLLGEAPMIEEFLADSVGSLPLTSFWSGIMEELFKK